jgi:hypothetical protein
MFRTNAFSSHGMFRTKPGCLLAASAVWLLFAAAAVLPVFAAVPAPHADDDLFTMPGGMRAGTPLLTIFYDASTFGETRPCPTCGGTAGAYGGMARRVGLFHEYRKRGGPCLVIAGPYEFTADDPFRFGHLAEKGRNALPPAAEAVFTRKLHAMLGVDAGWISHKAAEWMKKYAGGIPAGYLEIGKAPRGTILRTPIGPVGIVFFPEGDVPGKGPAPEQKRQVLESGRELRGQVRLLLGVSPWGLVAEKSFLPEAGGIFDGILGGGEGVGFGFSLAEKVPGLIWLRPDGKGRAVNVLELYAARDDDTPFLGEEGKTFDARLDFMGEDVSPDRAALDLIRRREGM